MDTKLLFFQSKLQCVSISGLTSLACSGSSMCYKDSESRINSDNKNITNIPCSSTMSTETAQSWDSLLRRSTVNHHNALQPTIRFQISLQKFVLQFLSIPDVLFIAPPKLL